MDIDSIVPERAAVAVLLQMPEKLAAILSPDSLKQQIGQELQGVLDTLGIPANPVIHLSSLEINPRMQPFLAISVNHQPCLYSSDLLRRAYDVMVGSLSDITFSGEAILEGLLERLPEQVSRFVQLVCLEVVQLYPAGLLTEDALQILSNALNVSSSPTWLYPILTTVLNLRISIADRPTIAQILTEGQEQGKKQIAIAEDVIAALRPKVIEVQMSLDLLRQITLYGANEDRGVFGLQRDGLFYELGIRYPAIRFVPTETIDPGCFRFKINHLTTLPWRGLQSNECLVNETPDRLRRFLQLDVSPASVSPANVSIATVQAAQEVPDSSPLMDIQARPCSNPANRNPCSVIDIKHEPAAKAAGFTTWNAMGYLVLVSSYELRTHATCFCDRDVVATELKNLENTLPKLVSFAQAKIPLEWLTQTLRCLLAEEISIRNLRQILQAIVDYDYIVTDDSQFIIFDPRLVAHQEPGEDWLYDPVNLAAFIRTTMKRYISYKYTRGQNTLVVYLLDSEIEQLLTNDEATAAAQHHTKLATEDRRRILAAVREELKGVPSSATTPAVLTVTDVRHAFQSLIYPEFPYVPVLSYQELSLDMNIQPIARISIV